VINENRTNDMVESVIAKDSRIKNLSQFLHNLGVADGTISDIDRNFLIFSCRR